MNHNRTFLLYFAVAMYTQMFLQDGFGGGAVPVIPVHGKSISVFVGGKEKKYYILTKSGPFKIEVDGPAKVEILTRLSLPRDDKRVERYSIKVKEGSDVVKEYVTSSERSDASYADPKYVPAKSRKFTLVVPEGSHAYEFSLLDTALPEAALRLTATAERREKLAGKTVRLEPLSYDRVATAVVMEKLITYYVCSKEKTVQLRVVGPTQLEIAARLNYDTKMQGAQTYTLTVWEGAQKVSTRSFTTTKALGVEYQDWKEVVPGKIDVMSLAVKAGEHIYQIRLDQSDARSVSLKFSIPEKDLKNE